MASPAVSHQAGTPAADIDRLTPAENAALVIDLEERERTTAARQAANRLWRLVVLSPNLEVCEALCRGEAVDRRVLDPAWARRFRLL